MTTRALSDYLGLLPSSSVEAPNFVAFVSAVLQAMVDTQNCVLSMPAALDIDAALGVQLDDVGARVGLSRQLSVPIAGVYFSFDTVGLGFDQGVIQGPNDPATGLVALDDETYLQFLRIKIAANSWNGSIADLQRVLNSVALASPGTLLFVQDKFDMSMVLGVAGNVPSTLFVSLLRTVYSWIRPATSVLLR
jgi:hypothetical protein